MKTENPKPNAPAEFQSNTDDTLRGGRIVRHLDLFSGIGGFALACQMVGGIETIGFSEINKYASKLLAQNFPGIPNYGDIRNIRGITCDLITGGFPCQPYSLAGKRRGAGDDRALWPEMCRVVAESKPRWVLGENVAGIISMELDRVLSDLESLGYSAWPLVIPAVACDAKHRRDRVWIVAHANGGDCGTRRNGCQNPKAARTDNQSARPNQDAEHVANTSSEGLQGHGRKCELGENSGEIQTARNGEAVADSVRGRQPRPGKSVNAIHPAPSANREATQPVNGSQPHEWQPEPAVGRSLDGLSTGLDRNRLILESHKLLLAYGKTTNQRPDKIMSALRDSIISQDVQWTAGGCNRVSASEILLTYLCELEASQIDEAWIQLEGEEASEIGVRGVRPNNKPSRASSRPRHQQQYAGEHPDTLQALSRLLAQHSQKAWQISRWQDANSLPWGDGWEVGLQRVANGIPNRVERLKGLGNAIVPQVAAEIIRAMMRVDWMFYGELGCDSGCEKKRCTKF